MWQHSMLRIHPMTRLHIVQVCRVGLLPGGLCRVVGSQGAVYGVEEMFLDLDPLRSPPLRQRDKVTNIYLNVAEDMGEGVRKELGTEVG